MDRRLVDAFAAELGGIGATGLVFVLTFGVWRLTGLRPVPGAGTADAGGVATAADRNPSARVASAELDPPTQTKSRRTYNVILITVDTLRADLGFSGYPRPVTPNIDALAARGVVYEHAYAMASFTPKCLGPMLIGKYVSETERDYQHYTNFGPSNVFLAERIQAGGGHTVGAASHRYFGWKKGFDQGFDVWDTSAIPANSVDNDPTITSGNLTDAAIGLLSSTRASEVPVRPKLTLQARSGPANGHFFAWFHYLDPHLPYVLQKDAPNFATMRGEGIPRERAPYDAEVWYTDQQIGRLLKHIAAQPWASETAIIFTADHGEAFGEHAHWGHGRELWEQLVHVPFIISIPDTAPRKVAVRRSHVDLVPTVLELMNVPGDAALRGKSLLADIAASTDKLEERHVYIDMPEGPYNDMRRAIIYGPSPGTKLIDFGGGKHALYDLRADPNETKSLAGDRTRLSEAMTEMSKMRAGIREIPPTK
jgi:choline-sulfatase